MTGSFINGFSGAPPKPEKRGPKARKPLSPPKKFIDRNVKPSPVRKSVAGLAKFKADRKWSQKVLAQGPCMAVGFGGHRKCRGPLDPAHIIRRGYKATRFDAKNGMPLCRYIHDYFTRHPRRFKAFVFRKLGKDYYAALYSKAMDGKV